MNAFFKANEILLSSRNGSSRPQAVMGPFGEPLTLESLPPADCNRWTPRRKAEVVAAVSGGMLLLHEASGRYNISREEFVGWQSAVDRSGIPGLRATQAQYYKQTIASIRKNSRVRLG